MSLRSSNLASEMEAALGEVWQEIKGFPLPGGAGEDRRVLFLAIARGLLRYLESNQNDILNTITIRQTSDVTGPGTAYTVLALDLDATPNS